MGSPTVFVNKTAVANTTSTGSAVTICTHSSALKNPDGSSGNGGVMDRLCVFNSDTMTHTVKIYRVPVGGSAASSTLIDMTSVPTLSNYYVEGPFFASSGDLYSFNLLEAASSSGGVYVQAYYHEMA